jgi:hypothetical protein
VLIFAFSLLSLGLRLLGSGQTCFAGSIWRR